LLHIRKPFYTKEETRNLIQSIPPAFHSRIVLHQHYELLNEFNLKGAHLPEMLRTQNETGRIKNVVSTSFHNPGDILASQATFEYAFFSPVFPSISKQGYSPMIAIKKIQSFFRENLVRFPIIALGGITDQTILHVKEIGFNGVACIGYIWGNNTPVEQFKKLQKIVET
jgi:thiamine-phosphate pyrophosphorylase